jgi:hypothetical protein
MGSPIQKNLLESNLGHLDWDEANHLRESFVQACRHNSSDINDYDETPTPLTIHTHLLAMATVLGRWWIASGNREEIYTRRYLCHHRRIHG